jgi:hypothetical protein
MRGAAAFVLVVQGDVADAGVQPHRDLLVSDDRQLGAEHLLWIGGERVAGRRVLPGLELGGFAVLRGFC